MKSNLQSEKKHYDLRYRNSRAMLERALKTIPLGSQTFSKSITQYPVGVSPHFIKRGEGARVWDVDGNEYIDFVNSLAAVTLGYNDPDVTLAVMEQIDDGTVFSLPHELEVTVAEQIAVMVPCAEKVRFGKNGSDATTGAVRLARAFTGRDHIAVCGYHGWHDWYICTTSLNGGIPEAVSSLTHTFRYNSLASLDSVFKKNPGMIAAVIMEPVNSVMPEKGFLAGVRELAIRHGALLIFDETVTGFRFAKGGAQEYFGVTPDLATFGKGIANGYPLSVVAGRSRIMDMMEQIFFSFTYGGETLSLAAANAVLKKLWNEPVIEALWQKGERVISGVNCLIDKYGLGKMVTVSGFPCWSFLGFHNSGGYTQWEIKTLFLQEVFSRGILMIGTHNISYAHKDEHISKLLAVYDEVFSIIRDSVNNRTLYEKLLCEPLKPLFSVR